MNYMPSGTINQTSCKECIFAIYRENTQIGCDANRIEKFKNDLIEAYDDEKEFFVINRTCTLHRRKDWNNGKKDIEKALKESESTFDILINCDNISPEMSEYIKNFTNNSSKKQSIKIFHSYELDVDKKKIIKDILYSCPSINISIYFNKTEYIYSVISKSKNLFHVIIDETNYQNIEDFIKKIDHKINNDLIRGIIFASDNKKAILTLGCRILYPSLYIDYENNYPHMENQIKESNLYIEL